MANKKISQLTDGTSFQAGDEAVVNRSGTNYKVDPTQFGSSIDVTGTVTADGLTVESSDNATGAVTTLSNTNTSTDSNTVIGALIFENNDVSAGAANAEIKGLSSGTNGQTDLYIRTGSSGTLYNRAKFDFTGDISFYEDTGTTPKFFWDASAESLGIGTTSPSATLDLVSSNAIIEINSTGASTGIYQVSTSGHHRLILDAAGWRGYDITNLQDTFAYVGGGSGFWRWYTNNTERMRIDSSGNVLVSTTNTSPATNNVEGICLRNEGHVNVSRASGVVGYFNRKTDDGTILDFRKDGVGVGTIGSNLGSNVYITSGNSGMRMNNGDFSPIQSNNTYYDDAISLGRSTARWKDLYLSGGVYLGGTGAANLLDDYETGTWTPVIVGGTTAGTGTYTAQEGIYTKVGDLVTVTCWLDWSAHTGTGAFQVGGLPFSASAAVNLQTGSTYASGFDAGTSATQLIAYVSGSTSMVFRGFVNNATRAVTNINSSGQLGVTISYRAA